MAMHSVITMYKLCTKGKINKHTVNMGCIYNGVFSSLVALFKWQQVTHFAAVMANCGISPNRFGILSKLDLFSNSLCSRPSCQIESKGFLKATKHEKSLPLFSLFVCQLGLAG